MPRKTLNNGSMATVQEVIDLHELGDLAEDWSRSIGTSGFSSTKFARYQELCTRYGVDAAVLLYAYQARRDDELSAAERTGVMPVVPDVEEIPGLES